MLLRCREELISEKVGRERDCELLGSDLAMLRSHVAGYDTSQQQMNADIGRLRQQLSKYCTALCLRLAVISCLSIQDF